ncbi:MAG: aminotransferase class I/II-fold pyridoxal phosphate-dependent enzyme [Saprospiraceae bacterium]
MDLFEKIQENLGPLGQYAAKSDGYFSFPLLEGEISNRMKFKNEEMIIWSLNNYLGLANHPEVREADAKGAKDFGLATPMGARMMSGDSKYHKQLEKELAEFVNKESSYLLNYGYQGIQSIIDALLDRRDVVVYDSESHASIIDGVRLHLGKRFAFKHNDMESLEKNLIRANKLIQETGGAILVISEGVFGMRGDQGELKKIIELKSKYEFRLLVDDAHGFGTLGKTGAGAGEEQGVQDGIDLYFSTFAKSMASIGAFIAANKEVILYLKYNMRSQIFAKSLPMPIVIGNLKRLDLIRNKPELKSKLWDNVNYLQKGLRDHGFEIGNTNTCVTPIYLHGTVEEATQMIMDLRQNYKVFCSIVIYPVIPKGNIILRIIPTAVHTFEDIDISLKAWSEVRMKLKNGSYQEEFAVQSDHISH